MAKKYSLAALVVLINIAFISCSKDKYTASVPVYFSIPEFNVTTNYIEEGTAHSKITTVWIFANNEHQGTYELPCTVPLLLPEGTNNIRFYPGINLNGASGSRAIYQFYDWVDFQYNHVSNEGAVVADTFLVPDTLSEMFRTTTYVDFAKVVILEDFDNPGLNFEKTPQADTNIVKTNQPDEIFVYPGENNGNAGVIYTNASNKLGEVATTNTYDLPRDGSNIYVELTYKCNQEFFVGVIANLPGGSTTQTPTVLVNPKADWNKIYINLVTDITAYPTADNYKIFIRTSHKSGLDTGKVFLDNVKLVF